MRHVDKMLVVAIVGLSLMGCSKPSLPLSGAPTSPSSALPPESPAVQGSGSTSSHSVTRIIAVNLEDTNDRTELFKFEGGNGDVGISPDGRYVFFTRCECQDLQDKYIPAIFDRVDGRLILGNESLSQWPLPFNITWMETGFWIQPLVHFGLDNTIDKGAALRSRLVPKDHDLVSAEVSSDGKMIAIVTEEHQAMETSPVLGDLVIATRSGDLLARVRSAVQLSPTNRGLYAQLLWSPDSKQMVLCSLGAPCWLIDAKATDRSSWIELPRIVAGQSPVWAPTGQNLFYPGRGIIQLRGKTVVDSSCIRGVWNQAGTAVYCFGDQVQQISLDGTVTQKPGVEVSRILGWLLDGRLAVTEWTPPRS